jgi:hypothetical protein
VLWKPFLVSSLVVLAAIDAAAQAGRQDTTSKAPSSQSGGWSAASSTGLTVQGTWTAVHDAKTGTVTGTWTLLDAQGKTVAGGGWSAAKAPAEWSGAWRAVVTGREGEYSGTWTSTVTLAGAAPLAAMFEKAIEIVVSGGWRTSGKSGAWSIRTFK